MPSATNDGHNPELLPAHRPSHCTPGGHLSSPTRCTSLLLRKWPTATMSWQTTSLQHPNNNRLPLLRHRKLRARGSNRGHAASTAPNLVRRIMLFFSLHFLAPVHPSPRNRKQVKRPTNATPSMWPRQKSFFPLLRPPMLAGTWVLAISLFTFFAPCCCGPTWGPSLSWTSAPIPGFFFFKLFSSFFSSHQTL